MHDDDQHDQGDDTAAAAHDFTFAEALERARPQLEQAQVQITAVAATNSSPPRRRSPTGGKAPAAPTWRHTRTWTSGHAALWTRWRTCCVPNAVRPKPPATIQNSPRPARKGPTAMNWQDLTRETVLTADEAAQMLLIGGRGLAEPKVAVGY